LAQELDDSRLSKSTVLTYVPKLNRFQSHLESKHPTFTDFVTLEPAKLEEFVQIVRLFLASIAIKEKDENGHEQLYSISHVSQYISAIKDKYTRAGCSMPPRLSIACNTFLSGFKKRNGNERLNGM
jgi:hypothetical protein